MQAIFTLSTFVFSFVFICGLRVSSSIAHAFPKSSNIYIASKCMSSVHSNLVSIICMVGMFCNNSKEYLSNAAALSFTYFTLDTLQLLYNYRFQIIRQKYFYHHLIALLLNLFAYYQPLNLPQPWVPLYYFWTLEASNLFLPCWELARVNKHEYMLKLFHKPFVTLYICLRFLSYTHASYLLISHISYAIGHFGLKLGIIFIILLVDFFSVFFSCKIIFLT